MVSHRKHIYINIYMLFFIYTCTNIHMSNNLYVNTAIFSLAADLFAGKQWFLPIAWSHTCIFTVFLWRERKCPIYIPIYTPIYIYAHIYRSIYSKCKKWILQLLISIFFPSFLNSDMLYTAQLSLFSVLTKAILMFVLYKYSHF